MVRYILVYAVLLGIVALLLWIGRRYSAGRTNGGSPTRSMSFRKSPKSAGSSKFSSLVDLSSRLLTSRQTSGQTDASEVKQALEVLEELYDDFESDMSKVRTDFSLALEALHREMDARMTRLEEQMLATLKSVHREVLVPYAEGAPEEGALEEGAPEEGSHLNNRIDSEGQAVASRESGASTETYPELPRQGQATQLSPSHREALRQLQEGKEIEAVAQSLGLGIGEIAILKRLSLESTSPEVE